MGARAGNRCLPDSFGARAAPERAQPVDQPRVARGVPGTEDVAVSRARGHGQTIWADFARPAALQGGIVAFRAHGSTPRQGAAPASTRRARATSSAARSAEDRSRRGP